MKNVLAWIKGHLVVTISALIAVAALPALLFVSMGMNASLQEQVQDDVGSKQRSLQQISVTYGVEPLDPTEPGASFSATPNQATTEAMKRVIEARDRAATRVLELAIERNRAGKTPMLEGLFPAPDPAQTTAKRQSAAQAWIDAHEDLLARAGAEGPVRADRLAVQLEARRTQEVEKRLGTLGVSELAPEDLAEIQQILTDFRLQRLRERADDVTVYATMETFEEVALPETAELPTLERIWDWQHRYWVHEDLIEAVAKANRDAATGLVRSPSTRPVKRLVSISVPPRDYAAMEPTRPRDVGSLTSEIRPDLGVSLTGRAGWPVGANPLYNVRYAKVTAIVDGEGLERLIDSIHAENFMTVLEVDLSPVSPMEGLAAGYAYGGGSLLRAELVIETLWLRDWIGELAPDGVRAVMGMEPRDGAEAPDRDGGFEQEEETPRREAPGRRSGPFGGRN